jgi:LacI family transcriptional regulator
MPTILQVAKKAGVSSTTVSHVLNGTRFVSGEVKERVQLAIKELGYRPNALARSLRRGETDTLGLILPDSANPFFAEIGRAIEMEAFQHGYSVILCNTEGDAQKESIYTGVLSKKQVDGMIFVATGEESDSVQMLLRQQLPLVLVDRQLPNIEADAVLTNNRQGGILAAQHLALLGYKHIACVTGPSHLTPSAERVTGFLETLGDYGIQAQDVPNYRGDFHPESGYQAGLSLLGRVPRPNAVFCCNDLMAIGFYRAAAELGLRIPQDVAVIGFDDIELSSYLNPPLTSITQPKVQMGRAAVGLLLERITNRSLPARKLVLETRLVNRKSCGQRS